MRQLLHNKKGDWIQIFLISFFVILVVLALIMLMINKDSLVLERPELKQDILNQRATTIMTSVLRAQIDTEELGKTSLAAIIIMNQESKEKNKGPYDQKIGIIINTALQLGAIPYQINIAYPNGNGLFIYNYNIDSLKQQHPITTGEAQFFLPANGGNIEITLTTTTSTVEEIKAMGVTPTFKTVRSDNYFLNEREEIEQDPEQRENKCDQRLIDSQLDAVCGLQAGTDEYEQCKQSLLNTFRQKGCHV